MEFNELQTIIDENSLDKEVWGELQEFISSILFIQNLTSPNRKRAKDLSKDDEGKIIVDITNPHILEDMDYFRQPALHYEKFNKYTSLYPNSHKTSSYYKFWKEEARRCRDGYVREYDGEWIPGPYYFYLNYSPILRNKIIPGKKKSERGRGFPDVYDGSYLYFHYCDQAKEAGKHGGLLKRRGIGFSYTAGSGLARLAILGDSSTNTKMIRAFAIASEKEYLIKDGILNKFEDNVDWCASTTPWPRLKSKDSLNNMTWEFGFIDSDGLTQGTHNSVIGVTTQGNPDHARGKRGPVYWDEWGLHPNLLKAWNVARESVEEGDFAHSQMIGGGTGGTENADFAGAEEMFYNAAGYNILDLPNVYDKNTNGKTRCAFFFPAYMNRLGNYDKNGNSDVIGALVEIIKRRQNIKYNSTDSNTLVQHKAEMCITPQEAIMRREGSIFPVADLKEYLADITPDLIKFVSPHYVGHLKTNASGVIVWDKTQIHPPLRNYPLKDELDKVGCVEIFEMPHKLPDGSIPRWRYIAGIDPIDVDEGTYTNSLGSIFIFDTWYDRIVAEYTGRPPLASEFYDTCVKLLRFYGAIANYENNLKGLFQHFDSTRNLHLLCDTPQVLRDMEYVKGNMFGNRAHPYSETINTPTGKKLWGDIKIGDYIFGDNGIPTKVIDIPFDEETDIYKIQLSDNRFVYASSNHLWKVLKPVTRKSTILTTKELKDIYSRKKQLNSKYNKSYYSYEYLIPTNSSVKYQKRDIPLDAYTLGIILGDGTTKLGKAINSVMFASNLEDVKTYKKIVPYEFSIPYDDRHMRIKIPNISHILGELNLLDKTSINKFVPDIYKFNSTEIRLNILKGLMDTDGSVRKEGTPYFTSISIRLAEDVAFLARSLGFNCKITRHKAGYKKKNIYHKCNDYYSVLIWTDFPIFNLHRKIVKMVGKKRKLLNRQLGIPIINIEYSHIEKAKCITIDNESSCYLINDFIVTHNSKGTTASKAINSWGRKLQSDWLIGVAYNSEDDKVDESGNIIEVPRILNLQKVRSLGYLKELVSWNPDENFDRISAMGMLMILRADREKFEQHKYEDKVKTIMDDPWFRRWGAPMGKIKPVNPAKGKGVFAIPQGNIPKYN